MTITQVHGGVGSLAATYAEMLSLAATFGAAGDRMRDWGRTGEETLTDVDLLESAPLSPGTFAEADAAVVLATVGPDGVVVDAVGWDLDALLVRACVAALEGADHLVHDLVHALDHTLGQVLGFDLVATAPLWLGPAAIAWTGFHLLPDPLQHRLTTMWETDAQAWTVAHPGLVEHLVDSGGGLFDGLAGAGPSLALPGLLGFTPGTSGAAGDLAALYGPDGHAAVTPCPGSVPADDSQPASLADLMSHLQQVAGLSSTPTSPANGTIEIQTVTTADGQVRHIVYLPGTDDLGTLPWTQDGDVRDMGTNLLLVAGHDNAYQDGILQAMHDAGIRPDEPVLLVGHSQGGMEAAAILGQGSPFDVTDVVTAGSPTAQVHGFPPGTHVTSLEHQGDVVPLLAGVPGPDSVQQVTIQFADGPSGGIVDNHGYAHYVAGAAAADASQDPSIAANLASLHAHGFLANPGGASVSSQLFQITRVP